MSAAEHGGAEAVRLESRDGGFALHGPLTFATARRARETLLRALESGQGGLVIDCAGITRSDSAGLAVLLDGLAAARRRGRSLRLLQLPEGVLSLAAISDVRELLQQGV